mgnify:FL=1
MKKCTNNRTMSFRRLLSLLLGLVLFMELLPGGLTVVGDASDAVTVTVDGAKTTQVTLPQSGRVTLEAASETGDTDYQWQIQLDGDWVNIYDATAATLTLTYAMVSPVLEGGSAAVRCAAGDESVSDAVRVTVSYDVEADSADLNRQRDELTQGMSAAAAPRRTQRRSLRSGAPEYINVTVNYLDAVTSLPIYTGFSATIKGGEPYSQTVLSPTYLGYAPYWNPTDPATTDPGAATESAQSLTLSVGENYTGETYTVNVYYKAIEVPYAVRYYFQNIHDDMYTENVDYYRQSSALTGTIIANDDLKLDEVQARGFTKLYHYPEAVAADGSTVFECYYDRNYYQVKLDANGGYGSEHVYARYGTPFVATTPTRHGYSFVGWDKLNEKGEGDGKFDALPTTVPAENASYKALWKSADTTYTVVYWLKNAAGTEYDYMGSQKRPAVAGEVVSGDASWLTADSYICGLTEDAGHTHNEGCKPELFRHSVYEKADRDVTIKVDGSTTVNIYYTRKSYTLRFYYAKEYVPAEDTVNSPANPSDTPVYSVVGGSTRPFGFYQETGSCARPKKDGNTVNDVESLLYNVKSGDWGEVAALPTIQQPTGTAYTYTIGTYPDGGGYNAKGDRFHYLEFTVPYGTDLLHLWPTEEVFGQIKTARSGYNANKANEHRGEGQWGNYAYFAGWNGEYNVKYTQEKSNSTIKCLYPVLNDDLLYAEKLIGQWGDASTVNFLGFFDNGANVSWSIPRQWIYKLYVEVLPGHEEDAGVAKRTVDGVERYYMLYDTVFANDDNTTIKDQTDPPLPGFTCMRDKTGGSEPETNEPLADGRESYTANFYYNRNSYTLTAQNYDEIIQYNDVLYQADLDRRMYDLLLMPYPKPLEKYAYKLGGWYTSPGCFPGSEYVPGSTMPEHDISLYAKWEPVTYTVRLFKNRKDMETYQTTGKEELVYHTQVVNHGSTLGEIADPTDPSGHEYTFGGWFYEKSGKKVALTPTDTAVKEDLLVYAEWSHLTAQPYLIHYVLKETADAEWKALLDHASLFSPEDGKAYTVTNGSGESRTYIYYAGEGGGYHQQIAADSRGYANQGSTRTFYPKAGDPYNQLYSGFNSGYYPTLASHSITMEEDTPSNPTVNVFTFYYVHAATVSYKVEYRYHDTGELIESDATGTGSVEKETSKAVVTERFAVVKDCVPDAFYKRLVLAVVEDGKGGYVGSPDNVVTFYYTKNIENAYYAIHYMLQNVDAATDEPSLQPDGTYTNYTESTVYTEGISEIGAYINVTPQKFSGFTMRNTAVVRWGTDDANRREDTLENGTFTFKVRDEGTELYVFYTRNTQNYVVRYLRYGSDPHTTRPEDELAASKTDSGKYGAVVTATAESIDGYNCVSNLSQSIVLRPDNSQNEIIFYYEPLQYTVEYRVWAYGGGTLNNTLEVVEEKNSFEGATPAAKSGYTFDGWYQNAECTIPVGEKGKVDTDTKKLMPERSELLPAPQTNVFYARFKAVYGNVTITREAKEDESNGVGTYVYRLTSKDNPAYVVEVTVPAGDSTTVYDLPCGDYTVEQVDSWSWRYADGAQTVTVENGKTKTVTFDRDAVKEKWLTGSSDAVVNRREA